MSRPVSQHRLSVGANASSVPTRTSMSRTHSHTASASRINRRKSSTFSRAALASLQDAAVHQSMVGSLPATSELSSSSAVVDGPSLSSFQGMDKKLKMRRASDGTHLLSKKEKAASGELKCEHCGKAYKHGSCLTKHLWEHTPEWQLTSKLLISKHQQVQLLEAASVLVAMNQDGPDSDNSSSPAASGSSDMRDEDLSSTETTPPPQGDNAYRDSSKRFSNNSSIFSRSYQSAFSESVPEHGFSHNRHWSTSSGRPLTAGSNFGESYTGNEDAQDLAAAVGLLSCSYGTPKSAPSALPMDAPPVPPLPAKYQTGYSNFRGQGNDVDMEDEISSDDEPHHSRNDDVDDGMFGKMDA